MIVSIIIPIYNVENYIERCIKSVMQQTYPHIECILVDDRSTDKSISKCEELISIYRGPISFLLIKNKGQQGPSDCRNTGTNIAKGDYLFYLDSDDEITSNCIKDLVEVALSQVNAEIIQGNTISHNSNKYQLYNISGYKNISYIEGNNNIRQEYFKPQSTLPIVVWNKLIKKSFLLENNISFKSGIIHEDQLWTYHVVKKITKIAFVFEYTYIHYRVPNSIMTALKKQRSYDSWGIILKNICETLDDPCYKNQLFKYFLEYFTRYDYYSKNNNSLLLNKFKNHFAHKRFYKLSLAITLYKLLNETIESKSIYQWIYQYCILQGNYKKSMTKQFISDLPSFIKTTIKNHLKK